MSSATARPKIDQVCGPHPDARAAMRTGAHAPGRPAYNGALFAADGFDGAAVLERAAIPDAALGPALVALGAGPDDAGARGRLLGPRDRPPRPHLRGPALAAALVADRDYRYDARADRYVPAAGRRRSTSWPATCCGRPTKAAARAAASTTPAPSSSATSSAAPSCPAFEQHLEAVAELAVDEPGGRRGAAVRLPGAGPGLRQRALPRRGRRRARRPGRTFLGDTPLPAIRDELDALRAGAGTLTASAIEDVALLRAPRPEALRLRRRPQADGRRGREALAVAGDRSSPASRSPTWTATSSVGNSLIGVARPEQLVAQREARRSAAMLATSDRRARGAGQRGELASIADRTPDEVDASAGSRGRRPHDSQRRAERLLRPVDRRTVRPRGRARASSGRRRCDRRASSPALAERRRAGSACQHRFLHWPLAFPEVFARDARLRRRRRQPAVGRGHSRGARLLRALPARATGACRARAAPSARGAQGRAARACGAARSESKSVSRRCARTSDRRRHTRRGRRPRPLQVLLPALPRLAARRWDARRRPARGARSSPRARQDSASGCSSRQPPRPHRLPAEQPVVGRSTPSRSTPSRCWSPRAAHRRRDRVEVAGVAASLASSQPVGIRRA